MEKEQIGKVKGDANGKIKDLIQYLKICEGKGATHYSMSWSKDPEWAFKWFETYRSLSEDEVREIKIKELEKQIEELKNDMEV